MAQLQASTVAGTLTTTGNVGIGTTTLGAELHVKGTSTEQILISFDNTKRMLLGRTSGYGWIAPYTNGVSYDNLVLARDGGLVGIGTAAPLVGLDVRGTTIITNQAGSSYNENLRLPQNPSGYAVITLGGAIAANGSDANQWSFLRNPSNFFEIRRQDTVYVLINSSGNVGIGTESPTYPLHVSAGTNLLRLVSSGTDARINIGHSANGGFIGYTNLGATGNLFYVTTGAGTIGSGFVMDNNGNVGIGTTNPTGKLAILAEQSNTPSLLFKNELGGPSSAISNYVSSAQTFTVIGTNLFVTNIATLNRFDAARASCGITLDEGNLIINTGGTGSVASLRLIVNASGNVGIGTNNPIYPLVLANRGSGVLQNRQLAIGNTATGGTFMFLGTSATTSGYGLIQHISVEGTSYGNLALQPEGANVGIGTTTPASKLEVFENADVWHTRIGGASGQLRIGGQTPSGAVIQAYTPAGVVRDLYIQRDGGKVGIGTAIPTEILDVRGNIRVSRSGVNDSGIIAFGNFLNLDGYFDNGIFRGAFNSPSVAGNLLHISSYEAIVFTSSAAAFGSQSVRMFINGSNGNIGIGTTTPSAKLQVVGTSTFTQEATSYSGTVQSVLIDGNGGNAALTINATSQYAYLNFAQAGTTQFEIGTEGAATNKGSLYINHNIQQGSAGAAIFIKKSDGNVGIGTISPNSRLTVNGASTGTVPLVDLLASGTGLYQRGVRILNSAMAANSSLMGYAVGRSDDTRNQGQMVFNFIGAGSTSNYLEFGLFAVDNVLNIAGTGNVGIGVTNPGAKFHIDSGDGGATAYALRTDAVSLDYALYVSASGNVAIGGLVPAAQLNHKLVVFSGSIALRGPNDPNFSYRLNDTAGTNRNALYVSSSNYLNVGNAAFAGLQLFHTGSAPGSNNIDSGASRYYGTDQTYYLAEPDKWLAVRINSVDYVMPLYQV